MKKQKIQLIVLVLMLAALAGAFFGIRKYKETQAQKPAEEEGIVVFSLNQDDIVNIIYDYAGVTYQYEKVEDTWYLAEDHSQGVKQFYLSSMTMGVASIIATQVLENVTDLSQYGLETPRQTIIFDTADQRFQIYVGEKNTMTSSCYIQLPDQPGTVYIVPQTNMNRFERGSEAILEVQEEAEPEVGADAGANTDTDAGTGADAGATGSTGTE